MVLAFAVNEKQKKVFEKLKKKVDLKVVKSKNVWKFSLKAFKYLDKVDLKPAVDLRVKDFYAKYELKIPKFLVETFYFLLAYFTYFRYFGLLNEDVKKVVVWNGLMFRQYIFLEIAKLYNIQPIFMENGFFGKYVIDCKGVNFLNSMPREREFYENYQNEKELPKELIPRAPKNAKKFLNAPKPKLPERFIFIPFQVDYDTQILLFSPWIKSMRELFYLIREVSNELDLTFVFKEHPSSIKDYPDLYKLQNEKLFFANGYPTQELIEKSSGIITINSSVGIEGLLFHKKVITLGDAFFNIDGIVKHPTNREELVKILKNLEGWEADKNLIDKFLKYLYFEYLVDREFEELDKKEIECLFK